MEVPTFILCCVLVASVAAFTIPDGKYESDNSRNDSLLVTAGGQECQCKNGRCVKDNRGKSKCNCPKGYALQDESTCEVCNCGKSGKCMFLRQSKSTGGMFYEKKCLCEEGFAEKDGECIDCHCGEHSKCEFEGEEKICYCIDGYSEKEGVCTECNCGFFGDCKFESGSKKCLCAEGYEYDEDDGDCKANYCKTKCGPNEGVNCDETKKFDPKVECMCRDPEKSFDLGEKVCKVDYCKIKCGDNEGVDCDKSKKFHPNVECACNDAKKSFDSGEKECKDCNCGLESHGCRFEGKNKVCQCVEGYTQKGEICKVKCSYDLRCQNGGLCREGICVCLQGTNGDFCDVIDDCKDLCPQQRDINCTYHVEDQKAFCNCSEKNKGFHPGTRDCRATCDSGSSFCRNGGRCTDINYSRLCTCVPGTEGDFCEEVPECEKKDCGLDASCKFNSSLRSAVCECHDGNLNFDPEDRRCKKICQDTLQCRNGGTCEDNGYPSKFCRCLEGTKGDFCEEVIGCNSKDCGDHAYCKYDVASRIAVCECEDKTYAFDPTVYKCRRKCFEDNDCHNGGSCESRGNSKFCNCSSGTTGDVCEIVDECAKNVGMCEGESQCTYDILKRKAFCQCPDDKKKYDPLDKTCKETCYANATCQHGGLCMPKGDDFFCRCKIGISGPLCEIVNDCERGVCGDMISTSCDFDVEAETVKCGCKDTNSLFDVTTRTCKTCDCGKNSVSCRFEDGEKVCHCPDGFVDEDGLCKKKWCVDKKCENGLCQIIDDKEVCSCFEGYDMEGDYCRKLNCSKTPCINGTCVVRHGNVEECVCQAGFTLNRGLCLRGLCRIDTCFGGRCEFVDGELTCVCPNRYHWDGVGCFETVCEIQRCFGGKCVVEEGQEICTCLDGYILVNDVCKKIICEEKNCFGGKCNIVDGLEECTCPAGFSLFEDVCRENFIVEQKFLRLDK